MKTVVILIVGGILVLGLSVSPYLIIHNSSRDLANNLDTTEHTIYQAQWDKAEKQLALTQAAWTEDKHIWSSLIDHAEIDSIDISMGRLDQYVKTRSLSLAAGEVSSLKLLVDHISDKEKPRLHNVF